MPPGISLYTILCEDKQHSVFVERVLRALGIKRQIRTLPVSGGDGAADQFVLSRFATEVNSYRQRAKRAESALIVMIDADHNTYDARKKQFADCLENANTPPLTPDERVMLLIPRKNIETWIHALKTDTDRVSEEQSYPRLRGREGECHPQADAFAAMIQANAEPKEHWPGSLQVAILEFRRLIKG